MGLEISWHSRQGRRTGDNRDCCGIGLRAGAVLCIVLDGSTTGPQSGEFARLIARNLIDWFLATEGTVTAEMLIEELSSIHKRHFSDFRSDSASYVIALFQDEKPMLALHAGDCLMGRYDEEGPVDWLTQPHTLANAINEMPVAEIAASPLRNRLTRSFRAGQFMRPDVNAIGIESEANFLVATDGFWAGIEPEGYHRFLSGKDLPAKENQDDCSALVIRLRGNVSRNDFTGEPLENSYIATSG